MCAAVARPAGRAVHELVRPSDQLRERAPGGPLHGFSLVVEFAHGRSVGGKRGGVLGIRRSAGALHSIAAVASYFEVAV
jgi:hypothetical protein